MNPKRLKKVYGIAGIMIIGGCIAALIIYALNQNMNLFYTPTQVAAKEAPLNAKIRMGGMVEKGSLLRKEGLALEFVVTDFKERITIHYQGILPDLFREGQGVVALGRLIKNTESNKMPIFIAEQILAKHDENYMPKELAETLGKKYDPKTMHEQ